MLSHFLYDSTSKQTLLENNIKAQTRQYNPFKVKTANKVIILDICFDFGPTSCFYLFTALGFPQFVNNFIEQEGSVGVCYSFVIWL